VGKLLIRGCKPIFEEGRKPVVDVVRSYGEEWVARGELVVRRGRVGRRPAVAGEEDTPVDIRFVVGDRRVEPATVLSIAFDLLRGMQLLAPLPLDESLVPSGTVAASGPVFELQDLTGRYGAEEAHAWQNSLSTLSRVFQAHSFQPLHLYFRSRGHLALEYQLPASSSWCDVVCSARTARDGPL